MPPAIGEVALKRANDFAKAEKALNTRRAYTADFVAFRGWCAGRGVSALPAAPATVAAYLSTEADRGIKASSIGRRVAAISYAHRLAGLPGPTEVEAVRAVIRGIRRTLTPAGRLPRAYGGIGRVWSLAVHGIATSGPPHPFEGAPYCRSLTR
jgi:hypothetical protein